MMLGGAKALSNAVAMSARGCSRCHIGSTLLGRASREEPHRQMLRWIHDRPAAATAQTLPRSARREVSCTDASFGEKPVADKALSLLPPANALANVDVDVFRRYGFCAEAVSILSALQGPKPHLPSVVYLYDAVGSALFEDITAQPEYYLTRCEQEILDVHAAEIARYPDEPAVAESDGNKGFMRRHDSLLVELGAGSGKKMSTVLRAAATMPHYPGNTDDSGGGNSGNGGGAFTHYIPVDYSPAALDENLTVYNQRETYPPTLLLEPFVGTNTAAIEELSTRDGRKTFIFLGSSLGNEQDPVPLLTHIAAHLGPRDRVLLGVDLAANGAGKPAAMINAAYNDAAGVTQRFILNALTHVNRIVPGLNLRETDFQMRAEYNHTSEAVEITARCVHACTVTARVPSSNEKILVRTFAPGESIFIEQSGKFSDAALCRHTESAGLLKTRQWEVTAHVDIPCVSRNRVPHLACPGLPMPWWLSPCLPLLPAPSDYSHCMYIWLCCCYPMAPGFPRSFPPAGACPRSGAPADKNLRVHFPQSRWRGGVGEQAGEVAVPFCLVGFLPAL